MTARVCWLVLLVGCGSSGGGTGKPDAAVPDDAAMADGASPDAAPTGDGLPTGTVSFFHSTACPSGWRLYDLAAGRTLMPMPDGDAGMPLAVGTPLASGEDRAHAHSVTSSINLPDVQYIGVAGSGNGGLAPSGAAPLVATLALDKAGLPYVQLLVCQKTAAPLPAANPVPSGTRLFFSSDCPGGWTRSADAKGRYLLGLPNGGAAGNFGGAPLALGEQRTHTHMVSGSVTTTGHGIALLSGCCGSGYAGSGSYSFSAASSAAFVGLPYVQLPQCQKD